MRLKYVLLTQYLRSLLKIFVWNTWNYINYRVVVFTFLLTHRIWKIDKWLQMQWGVSAYAFICKLKLAGSFKAEKKTWNILLFHAQKDSVWRTRKEPAFYFLKLTIFVPFARYRPRYRETTVDGAVHVDPNSFPRSKLADKSHSLRRPPHDRLQTDARAQNNNRHGTDSYNTRQLDRHTLST